ncbi:unnamed protein product [Rotaria sp. Silwood2]|nr:unnamed protein product [Rotaria sp. Silwood2]
MLYSGSLDKDCIWWSLPTRQIRFKNSFPNPITNMLLAKFDTNDANKGSNISTPFTTFSSEAAGEVVAYTLASRNGHSRRPTNNDDFIKFMPMPPVDSEADERATMTAPTFAQMARLLLEQQMNSSGL